MERLHTDREILRVIYGMYRASYPSKGDPYLPIDVPAVAAKLGTEPKLLFGRLHSDMGARFKYKDPRPNTVLASIFEVEVGGVRHVVNFPYLTATLAGMTEQHRRNQWTLWLSIIAIVVSVGSALIKYLGLDLGTNLAL